MFKTSTGSPYGGPNGDDFSDSDPLPYPPQAPEAAERMRFVLQAAIDDKGTEIPSACGRTLGQNLGYVRVCGNYFSRAFGFLMAAKADFRNYRNLAGSYHDGIERDLKNPAAQGDDPWSRAKREGDAKVHQIQLSSNQDLLSKARQELAEAQRSLDLAMKCIGGHTGSLPNPLDAGGRPPVVPLWRPVSSVNRAPSPGPVVSGGKRSEVPKGDDNYVAGKNKSKTDKRSCEIEGKVTYWIHSTIEREHELSKKFDLYLKQIGCPPYGLDSKQKGNWGEEQALAFLRLQGYEVNPGRQTGRTLQIRDTNSGRLVYPDLDILRDPFFDGKSALGEAKVTEGPTFPPLREMLLTDDQDVVYPRAATTTQYVEVGYVTEFGFSPTPRLWPPAPVVFFKIRYQYKADP